MQFAFDLHLYSKLQDYDMGPGAHLGPAHLAFRIAHTQKVVWKGQQITSWKLPRRAVERRDLDRHKHQQKA
ncbi:hypothetical protein IscW_ISCW008792 [Ixodes scapularis]|uniref:Uncharacterized protein n=1 Tax=Ixodes scapularis TaxID=6945 RepID=B7Q2J1_IXOSC|nr:hypothetical protein IscW_ISCW008792 [Ixodes scapularis]|eukprot:XP_002410843.1 hypothetical protein IscW_ISCW008792 [Ixodes scapularis]